MFHLKFINAGVVFLLRIGSAHHGQQFLGDLEFGRVGHANTGSVLAGNPSSSQNRLRLGKQKRMLFVGGLFWGQPLNRCRRRVGCVFNDDFGWLVSDCRQVNDQPQADALAGRRLIVCQRLSAFGLNTADFKPVGVQS